jgi:hypothetical protein
MKAIELLTNINADHELHLKLPEDAVTGPARVIILFESDSAVAEKGNLKDFLTSLPKNTSGGLSHAEIRRRVDEERATWEDR